MGATDNGSDIEASLAARSSRSVWLCRWILLPLPIVLFALALSLSAFSAASTVLLTLGTVAVFALVGAKVGLHFSRTVVISDCEALVYALTGVLEADAQIQSSGSRWPRWVPFVGGYSLVSDVSANDLAGRVHGRGSGTQAPSSR